MRRFVLALALLCPTFLSAQIVVKIQPRTDTGLVGYASATAGATDTFGIPTCGSIRQFYFYAVLTGASQAQAAQGVTWTATAGISAGLSQPASVGLGTFLQPPTSVVTGQTITATSVADNTKSETLNVRLIPCMDGGVENVGGAQSHFPELNPSSAQLYPGETVTMNVNISGGSTNQATAVVHSMGGADVAGGNSTIGTTGTVTFNGGSPTNVATVTYTAPATRPVNSGDGMVVVCLVSSDDALSRACSNITLLAARHFSLYPATATVAPGYNLAMFENDNVYMGVATANKHNKIATGAFADPHSYPVPDCGTFSTFGLRYQAPASATTCHPVVASTVDQWTGVSVSRSGGTASATIGTANLLSGDNINVSGCSDSTLNGYQSSVTVSGAVVSWSDAQGATTGTGCVVSRAAQSTLTIGLPGANQFGFVSSRKKVRPYDVVSPASSVTLQATINEPVDTQLVLTAVSQDFAGVTLTLSQFTDGTHTLDARLSSCTSSVVSCPSDISFERAVNITAVSRAQGNVVGEIPDAMIPIVDQFPLLHQARYVARPGVDSANTTSNVFVVNRISPAYKVFPSGSGAPVLGNARAVSGGTSTITTGVRLLTATVDSVAGGTGIGQATVTYAYSDDMGATSTTISTGQATNNCSGSPATIKDGVTICFNPGGVGALADFTVGEQFQIYEAPFRNEVFMITLRPTTLCSNCTGTLTVHSNSASFSDQVLNMTLNVTNFTSVATNPTPAIIWPTIGTSAASFGYGVNNLQTQQPLAKRFNGLFDMFWAGATSQNAFNPALTFNSDGTVKTQSFTTWNTAVNDSLAGTATYQQNSEALPPRSFCGFTTTCQNQNITGVGSSEQTNAIMAFDSNNQAQGYQSKVFMFGKDEPTAGGGPPADYVLSMQRDAIAHQAGLNNTHTIKTLVTATLPTYKYDGFQQQGVIDIISGNVSLNDGYYEWLYGFGNVLARAHVETYLSKSPNAEAWSYLSNTSNGQGINDYKVDRIPSAESDQAYATPLFAYLATFAVPYHFTGFLHYAGGPHYVTGNGTTTIDVDGFESGQRISAGGNSDDSWVYPGRTSCTNLTHNPTNCPKIGGSTEIPLASLRLYNLRDAMIDLYHINTLRGRGGSGATTANQQVLGCAENTYIINPADTCWQTLHDTLDQAMGPGGVLPTVSSVSPNNGQQGSTISVTITGTGFLNTPTSINFSGANVSITGTSCPNDTTCTANFVLASNAAVGAQNVSVTNNSGTSGNVTFTVNALPAAPTLTSLGPANGIIGSSVTVALVGTNFGNTSTINFSDSGITVFNQVVVSPNLITATFSIAQTAKFETINVTVSTSGGTSGSQPFTIKAVTGATCSGTLAGKSTCD